MNILVVASEVTPFARVGEMADVTAALPKALKALGHDVRIVMPRYRVIDPAGLGLTTRMETLRVPAGLGDQPARVLEGDMDGVPVYFIDNPYYFGNRPEIFGGAIEPFKFAYFCRAVVEWLIQGDWTPEVVHCHDWQTGLIPVLINDTLRDHATFQSMAVAFTIHNLAYQGVYPIELLDFARIDRRVFTMDGVEFFGQVNCMKAGLVYSDMINTVSPTYAREIQTPTFGEGLDGLLVRHRARLRGILNGIDYEVYDPSRDPAIAANYALTRREGKAACKAALQRELGLEERPDVMLVGITSRLVEQKGFDLLKDSAGLWTHMNLQVAVVGEGQRPYESLFLRLFSERPNVRGEIGLDPLLARRIVAGADAFLMPSRFEPCGLGQLIALRYGAVPIVRATGGLADTVQPFNPASGEGNGFLFERYAPEAMLAALRQALATYHKPDQWRRLVVNALASDYSWDRSALSYLEFYREALRRSEPVSA